MIGLGIAAPNASALFLPEDKWQTLYNTVPANMVDLWAFEAKDTKGGSPDSIPGYIARANQAFAFLQKQIESYRPDAMIIVGADRDQMFSHINTPTFYAYTGKEFTGQQGAVDLPDSVKGTVTIPGSEELATFMVKNLVKKGFEMSWGSEFKPMGTRSQGAISHSISALAQKLTPALKTPIIPVLINAYFPPQPTADRCFALGNAIREVISERSERVAIVASGGLSYDPQGRWVDEPFDRWIIDNVSSGKIEELKKLFKIDSENLRGPTGEIRAWITVAAACQRAAQIIDYIPARQSKTGLCFAYWPAPSNTPAEISIKWR